MDRPNDEDLNEFVARAEEPLTQATWSVTPRTALSW
jgi:hypothetical protein